MPPDRSHKLVRETDLIIGNYNNSCDKVKLRKLWYIEKEYESAWKNQGKFSGGSDP